MTDRTIEFGDPPSYITGDGGEDPPDGNFVVAQVPGGGTKLLEYDDTAQAWQVRGDVDHNGNNITNIGSLSTGELDINNNHVFGWELLDSADQQNTTSISLSFDTNYDEFRLVWGMNTGKSQRNALLRFDSDSGSNYDYWDESGTKTTGESEIELMTDLSTSFSYMGGDVRVSSIIFRTGIGQTPLPQFGSRISGFTEAGSWATSDPSTVQVLSSGQVNEIRGYLYGVTRS